MVENGLGLDDVEFVLAGHRFPAMISEGCEWADEDGAIQKNMNEC